MPRSPFMLLPNATGRPGSPTFPPPDPNAVSPPVRDLDEAFQDLARDPFSGQGEPFKLFKLLGNQMPHTGAPPVVDNQPVINTQGTLSNPVQPQAQTPFQLPPGPAQPFQLGQRNQGGIGGFLAGLLGRELPPSLPTNPQVSVPELSNLSAEAARGGDPQRASTLRGLLERRQDVGPQGPLSTETPLTTADPNTQGGTFQNPFGIFERPEFQQ